MFYSAIDAFQPIAIVPRRSGRYLRSATMRLHRRGGGLRDGALDMWDNKLIANLLRWMSATLAGSRGPRLCSRPSS